MVQIQRIAIVGGGTSGWLAANHLGKLMQHRDDVSVTLIESPDIPTIGVGEGTVPDIRRSLQDFGISETDFIRRCDVTFKQSIKFCNWLDQGKHGAGNFYHHLFDYPYPYGDDLVPFWLKAGVDNPIADYVSSQGLLCELGLAPKKILTPEYQGDTTYAYHLNAGKFSKMLAENAQSKYGVKHLWANIQNVIQDDSGLISHLKTDSEGALPFDFYVDCSGFSSFLLGGALGVPFIDKSHQLLVDSALVVQVPTAETDPIPPYTVATAHQAGWIWDIALTERRGVGLVYSSSHLSDAAAEKKLDRYLGASQGLSFRKIPMKVGYRERSWSKNCVAIGLAQGFVEPLEATALILTDFAARSLTERFPVTTDQLAPLSERFNEMTSYMWDRTIDFIKLHYCISDRTDSDFWLDNKNPTTIPEKLQERLALWQHYSPVSSDFSSKIELFNAENYLYVLYGMKYKTLSGALPEGYTSESERQVSAIKYRAEKLAAELPKHRELIDKIKRYGLQKV